MCVFLRGWGGGGHRQRNEQNEQNYLNLPSRERKEFKTTEGEPNRLNLKKLKNVLFANK